MSKLSQAWHMHLCWNKSFHLHSREGALVNYLLNKILKASEILNSERVKHSMKAAIIMYE